MRISTKGRYGLRAVIDIAQNCGEGQVSLKDVSQRQGISENYLEQIIFPLKKAGILKSVRGSQGGYLLARSAAEISAGEVLRALEGDLAPVDCLAGEGVSCERSSICPTIGMWSRLQDAINSVVDTTSIQNLIDEEKERGNLDCGTNI